jgi:predicted RNA-binding protein with EMAP domain
MATIVTLKSVKDGLHTVEIKREFYSSPEVREFTKAALDEYLENVKKYCEYKRYEFIYREELTEKEAFARLDDIGVKVVEQELGFQKVWAEDADKKMTCRFFLEDWMDDKGKNIAVAVYWNGEQVELYRF